MNNENNTQLLPINIVIADRNYRVKVAAKDEELVRKTIKLINEKIIEFKTQFAGKDLQDYVAMVLVWYATQNASSPAGMSDLLSRSLLADIEKMDQKIAGMLQEPQHDE